MQTELAVQEVRDLTINTDAVLDAVRNPEIDAKKAAELFGLAERLQASRAKALYASAMNEVQSAIRPVRKAATNDHTQSHYARLEDVDRMLKPICDEHGFSLGISTKDSPVAGHLRVVLTVTHRAGHSEQHFLDAPIDDKGIKGSPTKTALHGMGSTLTYCARYLKCLCFNVPLVGHDDDGNAGGNGPGAEPISQKESDDLACLITEVNADSVKFCAYFGIEAVKDLPRSRHTEAVRMLERKRK